MYRAASIVAVLLLTAGVAYGGPADIVSYYSECAEADGICPVMMGDDFVLTDIVISTCTGSWVAITQDGATKIRFLPGTGGEGYHLNSGVPLHSGQIDLESAEGSTFRLTLCGYIPDPPASVFSASNLSLGATVIFIVAVGGFIFGRVKLHHRERVAL